MEPEAPFLVPCCSLLPSNIAHSLARDFPTSTALSTPTEPHGSVAVALHGTEALRSLLDLTAGSALVLLVPCAAAAAIVGARGQKVQEIAASSGASLEVRRERLADCRLQPVHCRGEAGQLQAAASAVLALLQDLADRGRLAPGDFALPNGESAPSPVVLVLDMAAVGYVIGKQGRRVAELQARTGATVGLAAKAGLPGMRCGDRLLEVAAADCEKLESGLRAVLSAVAEAEGKAEAMTMLIPSSALGYVIGKGGEFLRAVTEEFQVTVALEQEGPEILGGRAARISGPERAKAALAIMGKVDELRTRGARPRSAAPERPPSAAREASLLAADGTVDEVAAWPARTAAERALLKGIRASGVLDHELSIKVPQGLLSGEDVRELARRSGTRVEVKAVGEGQCFVSVAGQRVSTSLAALYLQEKMARCS